ncbi:MAG: hypothetical protein WCW01_04350 [Gammaproteobacteria bacterium]
MQTKLEQLEFMIHKLRGLQQTLGNFTKCLEYDVKAWSNLNEMNSGEVRQNCDIILQSLCETKKVIEDIKKFYL